MGEKFKVKGKTQVAKRWCRWKAENFDQETGKLVFGTFINLWKFRKFV